LEVGDFLTSSDEETPPMVFRLENQHNGEANSPNLLENINIPICTVKNTFTHHGFTLFLVEVDQGLEKWSILRRYSWFRNIYQHLLRNQIAADKIDFPPQRIFNSLSDSVIQERVEGLQKFLDFICQSSLTYQCVCAFLLPVRKLITFHEELGTFFSSKIKHINFIDPFDTMDCKYPEFKTRTTLDEFPPLTSFYPNTFIYPNEVDELVELRKAVAPYNKKN